MLSSFQGKEESRKAPAGLALLPGLGPPSHGAGGAGPSGAGLQRRRWRTTSFRKSPLFCSFWNSCSWVGGVRGGVKAREGPGEPLGASGVFSNVPASIPSVAPLNFPAVATHTARTLAHLNVSLFSRSNLESSSFTFWSLSRVTFALRNWNYQAEFV